MAGIIYVNTDTQTALAALTRTTPPSVGGKLQATLAQDFAFWDGVASAPAELDPATTFRFGVKLTPTGAPFAFTSTITLDASGEFPVYGISISSLDAQALRDAIGDEDFLCCHAEIEWTLGTTVKRAAFPFTIANANLRSTDGPPDPLEPESDLFVAARALCYDRTQTLTGAQRWAALGNLGITFVNGALRVVLENGDIAHVPLNSGEPPAA